MIVRDLAKEILTDRRVDSEGWSSVRLLLKDDGMGFSFHITTIYAGTETHIWYKNHLESVYCMSGNGEIETVSDGKVYQSQFGQRMKGKGAWADMLSQRFALACRKLGLNRERVQLDCSQYHPSLLGGQQSLF